MSQPSLSQPSRFLILTLTVRITYDGYTNDNSNNNTSNNNDNNNNDNSNNSNKYDINTADMANNKHIKTHRLALTNDDDNDNNSISINIDINVDNSCNSYDNKNTMFNTNDNREPTKNYRLMITGIN